MSDLTLLTMEELETLGKKTFLKYYGLAIAPSRGTDTEKLKALEEATNEYENTIAEIERRLLIEEAI